ncbi:MAG TPA: alanine--tRNA ligase [Candidatus Altiarchaeales archaeon]|nr:alanine--tRNA ligase [Candidatus Altiarchaeales archaeon]
MVFDFRKLKAELKPEFHKNYGKYYPVESLGGIGFTRKVCAKCGRGFWSLNDREFCDEPLCSGGYRFIGEKLTRKQFSYRGVWDEYVKTFKKWGYKPIDRYPVVCRWYEDLYFVNAGVNMFQPYVVAGEVAPPAPAVLEPQFCLRFQDIDSVGITGRHYTGFIMVGQHTFNTAKVKSYFKEEGIRQIHEFLTKGLGINPSELVYHEDVWAGGGNYGPSMEFFSRGLELGNQVYMQYQVLPDGTRKELDTKVIDMGAGLERWSWFSQGKPMSYDTVFPKVLDYLYKQNSHNPDEEFMSEFGKYCGMLDLDEIDDTKSVWNTISKNVGVDLKELKEQVFAQRAYYAIGDHTRSLLVSIHDGALPSNVGGGYNLRTILRRCWSMIGEYGLDVDMHKVFDLHVKEFGSWFKELKELGSLHDIIEVEYERYRETAGKSAKIVESMRQQGREVTVNDMVELYDSQGISPDMLAKAVGINVPDNFYRLVEERHETKEAEAVKEQLVVPDDSCETDLAYYEDAKVREFDATVESVEKDWVLLNRTYFYPEGGGQEADYGTLNGVRVIDVQKKGGHVLHKVEEPEKFRKGLEVKAVLDDARRTQLMQHHTSTHIVNAAARKVLGPHVFQAGAHKSADSSRLDITHYKAVTDAELKAIEAQANKLVDEAHKINIRWMDRGDAEAKYGMSIYQGGAVPGTELRIVEVEGVDVEACGGTHLSNTKEAGKIVVLSAKRIQDGVVRLEFKAGEAGRMQVGANEQVFKNMVQELSLFEIDIVSYSKDALTSCGKVFSVEASKLPDAVKRFQRETCGMMEALHMEEEKMKAKDVVDACENLFALWKDLKKKAEKHSSEAEVEFKKSSTSQGVGLYKAFSTGLNVKAATQKVKDFIGGKKNSIAILVNTAGGKSNIIVASNSEVDAKDAASKLSAKLGGGAGGTARLSVGGGSAEGAEKVLEEFFL